MNKTTLLYDDPEPELKAVKKSFDAVPEVAAEIIEIAKDMGVPQSAVILFALKDFFLKYHRERDERMRLKNERTQQQLRAA